MRENEVITVNNITKSFKVYMDRGKTLKERLITAGRGQYQKRDVLKGISFCVKKGEAIGLIGKNGCGKSTTLKMLTRIIYPDSGSIEIKGKVSSLLELGAGFHPDMSGRENIYLNASIFGLTKKEIDKKVDEIIRFSELEDFIENPVRTYSSGMYMRLAFSVAINVDAEVLLIDEILGVGDVSFQKKCFEKLQEIKALGTTIVIVSHSLEQLERICNRCIWISDGLIKEEGIPFEVNAHYYREMENLRLQKCKEEALIQSEKAANEEQAGEQHVEPDKAESQKQEETTIHQEDKNETEAEQEEKDGLKVEPGEVKEKPQAILPPFLDRRAVMVGNGEIEVTDLTLKNVNGSDDMIFTIGDSMEVLVKVKGNKKYTGTNLSVSITREDGIYCYGTNTKFDNCKSIDIGSNEKSIVFSFDHMCLLAGKYYINIGLYDNSFNELEVIWNAKQLYVKDENPNGEIGVLRMEHHWMY